MTLETNLYAFVDAVGDKVKAANLLINGNEADLAALTTTAKVSLLAAVNEVHAQVVALDAATSTSAETTAQINAAVAGILGGAPTNLDTLGELAAAINNNPTFSAYVDDQLNRRIRYDIAGMGLSDSQKNNARLNIDAASATAVGDTTTDFATVFNTGLL